MRSFLFIMISSVVLFSGCSAKNPEIKQINFSELTPEEQVLAQNIIDESISIIYTGWKNNKEYHKYLIVLLHIHSSIQKNIVEGIIKSNFPNAFYKDLYRKLQDHFEEYPEDQKKLPWLMGRLG